MWEGVSRIFRLPDAERGSRGSKQTATTSFRAPRRRGWGVLLGESREHGVPAQML